MLYCFFRMINRKIFRNGIQLFTTLILFPNGGYFDDCNLSDILFRVNNKLQIKNRKCKENTAKPQEKHRITTANARTTKVYVIN